MTDKISKEHRSWNMSRIRGKNTTPELKLRSMLHKVGYRYRLYHPNLPGKPDIVLKKYKAAVFVHGCFWHRHVGCKYTTTPKTNAEFWQKKFSATIERDRTKNSLLEKKGWKVITIWECELKQNPELVLNKIRFQLEK